MGIELRFKFGLYSPDNEQSLVVYELRSDGTRVGLQDDVPKSGTRRWSDSRYRKPRRKGICDSSWRENSHCFTSKSILFFLLIVFST